MQINQYYWDDFPMGHRIFIITSILYTDDTTCTCPISGTRSDEMNVISLSGICIWHYSSFVYSSIIPVYSHNGLHISNTDNPQWNDGNLDNKIIEIIMSLLLMLLVSG